MAEKKKSLGSDPLAWIGGKKPAQKKKTTATKEKEAEKGTIAAFNIKMPESLHKELKREVIDLDVTLNEYLLSIIRKRK